MNLPLSHSFLFILRTPVLGITASSVHPCDFIDQAERGEVTPRRKSLAHVHALYHDLGGPAHLAMDDRQ